MENDHQKFLISGFFVKTLIEVVFQKIILVMIIHRKKWFEKLKFEHADQEILSFVSPMPKVYVDILEKWEDSMIAKGLPKEG